MLLLRFCLLTAISLVCMQTLPAQSAQKKSRAKASQPTISYPDSLYQAMTWRNVGPFRGGRSVAVTGIPTDPLTYFMGTTGGGLWQTNNGGASWKNITDGFVKTGSVGAIAVADSDPNILYLGMGEAPIRGVMTSHGDGVYKSTDGGASWHHLGLDKVRQIARVRIDPRDANRVYVAAQGSPYQPTEERGVYRSLDGGTSWEKVLFVSEAAGACDLSIDVQNPRILYAAFWDHQRLPWQMRSGGPGSSIYKSIDGGDSWEKLTDGLPSLMGKIGVSVSPANPQRVYAIIEAEKGGLYRSDDGGKKWKQMNGDRVLHARSWYYMHIFADPVNPDKVVVLNAPFMQSTDGGKSFTRVSTPHGDNHDLWINPLQPHIMINANDGGANISYNGGKSWSTQSNQPTAQFYRINADNRVPYYLYGGQQDNSTVAIPSRTPRSGIANSDFYSVGGCESAFTAFDPDDPNLVYAGCYQGIISEYHVPTRISKDVMAYPRLGLGTRPADVKHRFNWNAPILVSQHDAKVIYHGGNVVLKSEDRGISWSAISPDLTRADSSKLDWGGAPITNEGAGGEVYHTLAYVAESPHDPQVLWTGADDGLIHISQDGGRNWTNITPPELPEGLANCIEVSPHQPGAAYLAFTRYKFNDFTPHIYVTQDYGQTWERRVQGIPDEAHVRVVREDPDRKGLLYAGTETGLFISFDTGLSWRAFQLNLPVVPITDLKVHHRDLLASTQGRAFWILDDLSPLHQLHDSLRQDQAFVFRPRDPYLFGGGRSERSDIGTNPDNGVVVYYLCPSEGGNWQVEFLDESGKVLFTPKKISQKSGMNRLVWKLNHQNLKGISGLQVYGGLNGHRVAPGRYQVRLMNERDTLYRPFQVWPDPRHGASGAEYASKSAMLNEVSSSINDLYQAVRNLRHVRTQVEHLLNREMAPLDSGLQANGEAIVAETKDLEAQLIQVKQKTFQDVINYPNKLDANLIHLLRTIDNSPPPLTEGQRKRWEDLSTQWQSFEQQVSQILKEAVPAFNEALLQQQIPFVEPEASVPGQ